MRNAWVIMSATLFLAGCASGYSEFYQDYSEQWQPYVAPSTAEPKVVSMSGDVDQVVNRMYADGYALVGISSFNGPVEERSAAIEQARKVGAERIVLDARYTNTNQGAIPFTTQQAVTSTTSGNVSAYGRGGAVYGTYSGTTTTMVPQTNYIPYAVDRYDQMAMFFAPLGPACVGVLVVDLTEEQKQAIGSNKAVRVTSVRRNSPAYEADIVPGDLIMSVDGKPYSEASVIVSGAVSNFVVLRGKEKLTFKVLGGAGCKG